MPLSGLGSKYVSIQTVYDSHLNGQNDDDERFGYDDQGNFYFTFVEDYVDVIGSNKSTSFIL